MGLAASGSAMLLYVVLLDLELGRSDPILQLQVSAKPNSSYRSSLCANVQCMNFSALTANAATFFVRSF